MNIKMYSEHLTRKGSELSTGHYGYYTSIKKFNELGFTGKKYHFRCIGRFDNKAIISTSTDNLHLKGDNFVFEVMGMNFDGLILY